MAVSGCFSTPASGSFLSLFLGLGYYRSLLLPGSGVSWIPETYVALMHGALSATQGGPDLITALQLWVAQQDAEANPQLGFTFLTKELFRLRYSALAMQVRRGGWVVRRRRTKECVITKCELPSEHEFEIHSRCTKKV